MTKRVLTGRNGIKAAGAIFASAIIASFAVFVFFGKADLKADGGESRSEEKAPTIFGAWEVSCWNSKGMVIEFSGSRGKAKGVIKVLGKGGKFHYSQGDEIFRLRESSGKWLGQFLWRNTDGVQRWQPVTFTFIRDAHKNWRLHGKTANEHCYEYMKRAE